MQLISARHLELHSFLGLYKYLSVIGMNFDNTCLTSVIDTAFTQLKESIMLHYAIVFLVIALIAGVLGFGGIAGSAVGIAKILFFIFLVLFVVSLIFGRRKL